MKHFFVTLGLLAVGAAAAPAALIHHYTFNGAVIDQAGSVDGLLHGDAVAFGGTLTLDGVSDYVSFGPNYLVPTSGTFSVALWAQYNYDGNIHEFISQGASGGPGFYIGPYGNEMRMGDVYSWSATPFFAGSCGGGCTGVEAPSDGQWHHYALTVNSGNAVFYIDGVQRGTRSGYTTGAGGAYTMLGTQFAGSGEYFNGQLRDVRIYDHALGGSEIESVLTGTPEPGTLALLAGALHLIWYRSRRR